MTEPKSQKCEEVFDELALLDDRDRIEDGHRKDGEDVDREVAGEQGPGPDAEQPGRVAGMAHARVDALGEQPPRALARGAELGHADLDAHRELAPAGALDGDRGGEEDAGQGPKERRGSELDR